MLNASTLHVGATTKGSVENVSTDLLARSPRQKVAKVDRDIQIPDCNTWSGTKFFLKSKNGAILHTLCDRHPIAMQFVFEADQ